MQAVARMSLAEVLVLLRGGVCAECCACLRPHLHCQLITALQSELARSAVTVVPAVGRQPGSTTSRIQGRTLKQVMTVRAAGQGDWPAGQRRMHAPAQGPLTSSQTR